MLTRRNKYLFCTCIALSLVFLTSTFHYRQNIPDIRHAITEKIHENIPGAVKPSAPVPGPPTDQAITPEHDVDPVPPSSLSTSSVSETPAAASPTHKFKYKPIPSILPDPIVDNFPLAFSFHSSKDLPPIPPWNEPPAKHVPEKTPLFIGFTRNWRLLQQVVVSYITAGWPAEDIYVVENTGVMHSNAKGLLSLQNPFFLNHTRLRLLGVNVLITPTLLSFAQLQNYYIWHSTEKGWQTYFWGHMDIIALSFEDQSFNKTSHSPRDLVDETTSLAGSTDDSDIRAKGEVKMKVNPEEQSYEGFKSLYANCVDALRDATKRDESTGKERNWAIRFFNYDKLALVNVEAFVGLGAWDTQIPFYATDCDMHARIHMAGLEIKEVPAGNLVDVGSSLDDLYTFYRKEDSPPASFVDPQILEKKIQAAEEAKTKAGKGKGKGKGAAKKARAAKTGESGRIHERAFENGDAALEDIVPYDTEGKERESDATTNAKQEARHTPLNPSRSPSLPLNSPSFHQLHTTILAMENSKASSPHGRNVWQARQRGGEGDPFYRDSAGFDRGIAMAIEHGRAVFAEKWGHRDCDVWELGLRAGDAWRVERDW
ncbi:hypothetical protein WAI453_009600 [Rhynchosporium graminicola]|uniref:Uncharacterized protein n=1 Tax=Rhynchosporium graminicola TaxID=2792576 RepID=A0A1E1L0X0_9HELO|nr:uncharacterized protein RCO7_10799 [Rhynchosporium commune]